MFAEIGTNAIPLMKDVFGNYVIQKFFEHGNQVQKKILAGMMKHKVVELSTQMYGCRVVQKVRLAEDVPSIPPPRGSALLTEVKIRRLLSTCSSNNRPNWPGSWKQTH